MIKLTNTQEKELIINNFVDNAKTYKFVEIEVIKDNEFESSDFKDYMYLDYADNKHFKIDFDDYKEKLIILLLFNKDLDKFTLKFLDFVHKSEYVNVDLDKFLDNEFLNLLEILNVYFTAYEIKCMHNENFYKYEVTELYQKFIENKFDAINLLVYINRLIACELYKSINFDLLKDFSIKLDIKKSDISIENLDLYMQYSSFQILDKKSLSKLLDLFNNLKLENYKFEIKDNFDACKFDNFIDLLFYLSNQNLDLYIDIIDNKNIIYIFNKIYDNKKDSTDKEKHIIYAM